MYWFNVDCACGILLETIVTMVQFLWDIKFYFNGLLKLMLQHIDYSINNTYCHYHDYSLSVSIPSKYNLCQTNKQ